MEDIKPITIIKDSFDGKCSNAEWLAFNCFPKQIPVEFQSDDYVLQFVYWDNYDLKYDVPIGRGSTVENAIADLSIKLNEKKIILMKQEEIKKPHIMGQTESICQELDELKKFL